MKTENQDGPSDASALGDRLFRVVASAALALGVGSGAWTISSSDDRYRAEDASRDFRLRDAEIEHLKENIQHLSDAIERIDRSGTIVPSQAGTVRIRAAEYRIATLEQKVFGQPRLPTPEPE